MHGVVRLRCAVVVAVPLLTLAAACSGTSSPSSPSPTESGSSAAIHDTLNPAGATVNLEGVGSEQGFGTDRMVYDDFVAARGITIRKIAWQGIRLAAVAPARFNLQIIADNAPPGAGVLYEAHYPVDQVNEYLDGTQACSNLPQQPCGQYSYSVALAPPFTTSSGNRYWLMVQAESPIDPLRPFESPRSGWLWRKGTLDNGYSRSTIANTIFTWDFAFAIYGG